MSKENPFEKEYSRPLYEPTFKEEKPAFKPLPQSTPNTTNEKDFNERGVPFLQEVKENKEARKIAKDNGVYVGSPIWHNFLIILLILTIIGGVFGFLYLGYNDHFKTDINQNITCPDIKIPKCPELDCSDVICEQQVCNITCPSFPNEININWEGNSSG